MTHDLECINQYTRRPFTEQEVYTFSVVLCDNEIDRDFERFSVEALHTLSQLFLGKTGIFDHNMKTGTPRQGRLGPRFPGHAQLEYRRVAVKPKSNERGCLKLLDSPFFIFQKQQELTTIEPSSSGKQFP